MIHMRSDHRCVMTTFMIIIPDKNIHIKNTEETRHDSVWWIRPSRKNWSHEVWARTKHKEIIEKMIQKIVITKNVVPQAKSEARKAQAKEKNAAAAEANWENTEARTEEVERMCKGNLISDSENTTNENDGWHPRRVKLSAASEDEVHIASNNDHVKHDMHDNPAESENTTKVTDEEQLDWETMMDDTDNMETIKEADGRHRGRLVFRKVNEEDDFSEFHNDLIEHNEEEVQADAQKRRRLSPWRLQGC